MAGSILKFDIVYSVLGHMVPPPGLVAFNVYPATKFAVTALSETLKNELVGSNIRVTVRKFIKLYVMFIIGLTS